MDIVIFRHGQTDWNVEGRLQGSTDVPLNALGIEQAKGLRERLAHFAFDLIVTSDLARAYHTALALGEGRNIPIVSDVRLREMGLGAAEGKKLIDLGSLGYDFPGREPVDSIAGRVNQVIHELRQQQYQCVALSSHGGVVWNWLSQVASIDEVGRVGNTDAYHLKLENEQVRYLSKIENK